MEIPTLTRDELLTKWKPVIDQTFDIFTWTSLHELAFLAECATQAKAIIEVGSYHGKSAKVMSLANPHAFIQCIDKHQDSRCERILKINLEGTNASIHSGTSSDYPFQGTFGFAFIDGGHLEEDVATDIDNLMPHMAKGSIISGHDWRHNNPLDGVNVAVEKAFDKHRIRVFESIWHIQL